MKILVVILSVVVLASSGPVSSEDSVLRSVIGNLVNCNSDLSLCWKEHALKAAERFRAARTLNIAEGITVVNNNPKEARSFESLSTDPELRNKQLTESLWNSASEIMQSSDLELSYGGASDDEAESRSIDEPAEEGRGKKKKEIKKKLKMLIPFILLAKAKAIALAVFSLIVIAVSVFKLALIAKIAFIIKLIALIKSLLAKKHSQEESGWQQQSWEPHVEHHAAPAEHAHGWENGWSRSRNEANSMAYSGYGI